MTATLSAYLVAGRVVSAPPETYVNETAARTVAQGIDDGVDEITTYGSTPRQNAGLLAAWQAAPIGSGL